MRAVYVVEARKRRGLRRLAVPAVLAACVLTLPSAASAEDDRPPTVNALVNALRQDPVVVDQTMGGGDAAAAHALLSDQVRRVPFPVYVALVTRPVDDPSSDSDYSALITTLHRKLDRPGLYIVGTTSESVDSEGFGIAPDPTLISLAAYSAEEELRAMMGKGRHPGEFVRAQLLVLTATRSDRLGDGGSGDYPSVVPSSELRRIAGSRFARPPASVGGSYEYGEEDSSRAEFRRFVSAMGFGFVAPLVYLLLRGRRTGQSLVSSGRLPMRHIRRFYAPQARPAEVRAVAEREVNRLAGALSGVDVHRVRIDRYDRAVGAREAAEKVLASGELADHVGAIVLVRIGRRDLRLATGHGRGESYHCCFFDPLHDEGVLRVTWRQGDSELRIPVCRACSCVENGGTPQVLRIGRKPYYERDDLWARTGYGALVEDLAEVVLKEWRR